MPARNTDLHGMVPDRSRIVLVLLDVINALDFPEGEHLLQPAPPMARRLACFRARVKRAGLPVVYVNDNYGRWKSDFDISWSAVGNTAYEGGPSWSFWPRTTTTTSS